MWLLESPNPHDPFRIIVEIQHKIWYKRSGVLFGSAAWVVADEINCNLDLLRIGDHLHRLVR